MTSYYVSTPRWTVRVDVDQDMIQRTTARYLRTCYGQAWETWREEARRRYKEGLRIVQLPACGSTHP